MSELTDKLEQIAQGIDALPESLAKALKGGSEAPMPKLPGASPAQTPAVNRASAAPKDDTPSLPGGIKDAKERGQKWFGHTGVGRAAARGMNAISEGFQKFKTGETDEERNDKRIGSQRGGLQSKTQEGGAGFGAETKQMVQLLDRIAKAVEAMGRKPNQPQAAPANGRQTQMFMRGGETQLAGGGKLTDIHGQNMAGPTTRVSVRARGAGGGGANAKVDMATKIAGIFGL